MGRTGLYWSDDRGRLNCAHGVMLHGTNCVRCERGDLPDPPRSECWPTPGFIPTNKRVMGFDTASGPDRTATGTYQRVGDTMRFTVDDIKTGWSFRDDAINGDAARMEEMRKRFDDILRESAGGRDYYRMPDPPWDAAVNDGLRKRWEHRRGDPRPRPGHYNCRSRVDPVWGDGTPLTDAEIDLINGHYRGGEIITDPNDSRGYSARRVGDERAPIQS